MTKPTKEISLDLTGLKKGEAIEALIKSGVSYAEAEAYWSKNGARAKGKGFRASFYKELASKPLTEKDVKKFIEDNGSLNDKKHNSHYIGIAKLVAEVRAAKK